MERLAVFTSCPIKSSIGHPGEGQHIKKTRRARTASTSLKDWMAVPMS
jgi:hypothetical protein